jgi:signal peptide peptidase SppA
METTHSYLEVLARSPLWALRTDYPIQAAFQAAKESGREGPKPVVTGTKGNKIAVIPVQGVLTKDGPSWYGSSYDNITRAAERAANDPEVKHIVLAVDSPGGQVTGLPETAAVLSQIAQIKPIHAMVEGMSASAAYWLTSQASNIVLTPSGEVGSVGVRLMHADVSKMLEDQGVKVTELYSGDYKTEWSPFKPLSDEAKADMQQRLEKSHNEFIAAVTAGRGARASSEAKAQRFGEGRLFSSNEALRLGLVDSLQRPGDYYRNINPAAEPSTRFA